VTLFWDNETMAVRGPSYSARMFCSGAVGSEKSVDNVVTLATDASRLSLSSDFNKLTVFQKGALRPTSGALPTDDGRWLGMSLNRPSGKDTSIGPSQEIEL
jgi:hypothetical protein